MEVKIAVNALDIDICYNLREIIFVQGQNVPVELEKDELDTVATHFLLFKDSTPIGVGRIIDEAGVAVIGRIGILKEYRRQGAGLFLMKEIINYCKAKKFPKIVLGAQQHAIGFYEKLGFEICSERYMDANIPHYKMKINIV